MSQALSALGEEHRPLLLAGYSLGAALAIAAAGSGALDGLLLLAPLWRLASPLQRTVATVLRPLLPQYMYMFADADFFGDPRLRRSLGQFFPRADPDDPVFQGGQDELARPEHTRRLALRFPRAVPIFELPAGHHLLDEEAAWSGQLAERVTEFAGALAAQARRPPEDAAQAQPGAGHCGRGGRGVAR